MNIGDYVRTPRFCTVRINAIFSKEQEARSCGYTEPTYYEGSDCVILGKWLFEYNIFFAAFQKTPT